MKSLPKKSVLIVAAGILAATLTVVALALTMAPAKLSAIDKSSVGLQMFGWNWNSIATECTTTLGPEGVDWVLTLPPSDHITGNQWWIHYQPTSYELNSDAGTRDEFAAMVKTCNAAGVHVVTDAVLNHMAGREGTSFSGNEFGFDLTFGETYQRANFHSGLAETDPNYCAYDISDWNALWERTNCQFPGLPDLATEQTYVREQIAKYLNDQISLGVSGFRIDAAKHMPPSDIAAIKKLLTNPDVFIVQEVPGATELSNEYISNGSVWAWDHAAYALNLFSFSGNLSQATGYDALSADFPDTQKSLTWITNHDTEHHASGSLTYLNGRFYELANIWMLAEQYGSPMLYSGYAFDEGDWQAPQSDDGRILDAVCAPGDSINTNPDDPSMGVYEAGSFVCLQRWNSIKGMIAWRDSVGGADKTDIFGSGGAYGFGRSGAGYVLVNSNYEVFKVSKVATGMKSGTYCDMVSGGAKPIDSAGKNCLGKTVEVDADGTISTDLAGLSAIAIATNSKLN